MTPAQESTVNAILVDYEKRLDFIELMTSSLYSTMSSKRFGKLIHSVRSRTKDPVSLRVKLKRKIEKVEEAGREFLITPDNYLQEINDLAGVRLLHLHTSQFPAIDAVIKEVIGGTGYKVKEGPIAHVWDEVAKKYFESVNVEARLNSRMYSSVHYVFQLHSGNTAEVQVRTLAEELWGEVDHSMNYPVEHMDESCRAQIRVLARVISGCTSLVDNIFLSRDNAEAKERALIAAQDRAAAALRDGR